MRASFSSSSSLSSFVVVGALVGALAVACGGATASVTDGTQGGSSSGSGDTGNQTGAGGGGGSTTSVSDAGRAEASTTVSVDCPANPPADGSACAREGLQCEWGGDPELVCNFVATCTNKRWSVRPPVNAVCLGPDAGLMQGCPASFSSVSPGQACTGNLICHYPEGTCDCYVDHTGVPRTWGCFVNPGCPIARPQLGTTCTSEGTQCDYGPCGNSVRCDKGQWIVGNGGCHP